MNQDENDQFKKWMIAENQDPFAGGKPLAPASPTPVVPSNPDMAQTDTSISEVNNDDKIQDSHPGHKPDDLTNYVKGQESQLDKYGPEQEQEVIDSILKSQGSAGNRFARAGAGLGDALMGVAGKSSPGFLNSLENREAGQNKMALESVPTLAKMNAEKMAGKERLEGMTSSTPLGASMTAPLAAFFERVGVPKSEIPGLLKNPAAARSVIEPFAQVMSADEKIKMETMLRQLEISQRGTQIQSEVENRKAQQKLEEEKQKSQSLTEYAKMPWYSRIMHPGISSELEKQSGLAKEEPSHGVPDLGSTFNGQKVTSVKRIK